MPTFRTQTHVPVEIGFSAQFATTDPFNTVALDVIFSEPDGTHRRVPAFWAGGQAWKVRYAAGCPGTVRWWSECSNASDAGLHNVAGAVEVEPYTGDNPLYARGPIGVAPDRRHLQHADGTPFFWLGDTWWMGLCNRLEWPHDFAKLADDRVAKGFNVVQLVAGLYPDMHPFDPRGANEAGYPWEAEYARIRPEYFDAADRRIFGLVDKGLMPCIVGAWGYFMPWMGESRLKAHWRYLIARYAALPVAWCTAGEANLPWYQADGFPYDDQATTRRWCDVMRSLRATDPWRRITTIHPTAINSYSARHAVDDDALLDIDLLQTPHDGPGLTAEAGAADTVIQSRAAFPTMPVVNGEASYEMLIDRIPASKTRSMFWLCMLNGAAGHTYGANGIWQVNRKGAPHGASPTPGSTGYGNLPWDDAMHLDGGRQIAAGKRWLERLQWWTLQPHFTWAAWDGAGAPAPGAAPVTAGEASTDLVAPAACGTDDGARVFYMLQDRPVVLRQLEPGTVYALTHFDTIETVEADGGTLTADRKGEIRLPAPGHGHDWVALLRPAAL